MLEDNFRIITNRFILRKLTIQDATIDYLKWFKDSVIIRFIESAEKINKIEQIKDFINEKSKASNALLLGIFDKSKGTHVGNIKYEPIDFKEKYAVMGIMIGEESFRGIGCGAEVLNESAKWVNQNLKIDKIYLGVHRENIAAIHSYKKVGFKVVQSDSPIHTAEFNIVMELSFGG